MIFVIADAAGEMADYLYNDLKNKPNYVVLDKNRLFGNSFLNIIGRTLISTKLNLKVRMPFKKAVYKAILHKFKGMDDLCFYLGTSWFDIDFINLIKIEHPNAKLVFNFHDTVESKLKRFNQLSIEYLKSTFDLVYTYSVVDAKKYGFGYIPDMYSKQSNLRTNAFPNYDVVFIGNAKGRTGTAIEIHKKLIEEGVNAFFYIVGVPPKERNYNGKGFVYGKKKFSLREMIERELAAKCILEITQPGCIDATLRFWDAVMYNKKIVSNCLAIKTYGKYYDERFVSLFDDPSSINVEFIKNEIDVDYNYSGDISPTNLFSSIEMRLMGLNED